MWDFAPAPKVPGTNRTLSVEATDARLCGILALVPITRVSDISPLDPLGLPVYSATTPLAADLTCHMGKGRDAISAKVSAVMESVERVSAEAPVPGTTRRGTFEELANESAIGVIEPA